MLADAIAYAHDTLPTDVHRVVIFADPDSLDSHVGLYGAGDEPLTDLALYELPAVGSLVEAIRAEGRHQAFVLNLRSS